MPEPTPPKPTQRAQKTSLSGSSPGLKTVKTVTPKPGATGPIPRATTARRPRPPPKAEVVSSSEDIEVSSVRQTMATTGGGLQGLSLRWKIVAAMVGITVVPAIFIFIVAHGKASSQPKRETAAKGVRRVKTPATIDPAYWKYAIHYQPDERKRMFDVFLKAIPDLQMNEVARQRLFNERPDVKLVYDALIEPLGGEPHPLRGNPKDYGPGTDIIQMSVLDATNAELAGISAVKVEGSRQTISPEPGSARRDPSGVETSDGSDKSTGTKVRLFTLNQTFNQPANLKLRYFVVLSLAQIIDARSSMRNAIFVPIVISGLLGIAIAIWLSTLITEPIKVLVADMHE